MKIAVFCGSAAGYNPDFTEAAGKLGKWIAAGGHTLVYGGGESGLMGILAEAVCKAGKESGSSVIGIIPGDISFIRERPQPYCTEVIVAENMAARKQKMMELADAFIALPGGIGTLDEITEAMTLTRIGGFSKPKPCVLVNTDNYYDPMRQMLIGMIMGGFITIEESERYLISDDLEEIAEFLEAGK